MAPKESQLANMIEKTEEHMAAVQAQILAGGLTPENEAAAMQAVEDAMAKVERLQAMETRLEGLKKKPAAAAPTTSKT
jgi:hypothetical protein